MRLSEYAEKFIGNVEYVWAGNDIMAGVDCSGFVCEMLRAMGELDNRDLTAQGIAEYLIDENWCESEVIQDAIVFYGPSVEEIGHVAIALNERQVVEAGGEGRVNTNKGYVRVRPVGYRSDICLILHPSEWIQLPRFLKAFQGLL
jgi:cell wall-associated NlpC family hydrolase